MRRIAATLRYPTRYALLTPCYVLMLLDYVIRYIRYRDDVDAMLWLRKSVPPPSRSGVYSQKSQVNVGGASKHT